MVGNNKLIFNEATMIEAMQEYLDKRMGSYAPQVTTVILDSIGSGSARTFAVLTADKEASRPV